MAATATPTSSRDVGRELARAAVAGLNKATVQYFENGGGGAGGPTTPQGSEGKQLSKKKRKSASTSSLSTGSVPIRSFADDAEQILSTCLAVDDRDADTPALWLLDRLDQFDLLNVLSAAERSKVFPSLSQLCVDQRFRPACVAHARVPLPSSGLCCLFPQKH